MGREIERKYLVVGDGWRGRVEGELYRQAYLSTDLQRVVRIRRIGDRAWMGLKGQLSEVERREFEYEIPVDDAEEILAHMCLRPVIEKTRYRIPHGRHVIEVDEFHGRNDGLVVAEIELETESEQVDLPDWLGDDVSREPRYTNARLQEHPYDAWSAEERGE